MRATLITYTALVAVALCLVGIASAATDDHAARACFPASSWDAPQADRPCVSVDRPQEDGSVKVIQGTPRGAVSVCILPNPTEETGRYVARCYRR